MGVQYYVYGRTRSSGTRLRIQSPSAVAPTTCRPRPQLGESYETSPCGSSPHGDACDLDETVGRHPLIPPAAGRGAPLPGTMTEVMGASPSARSGGRLASTANRAPGFGSLSFSLLLVYASSFFPKMRLQQRRTATAQSSRVRSSAHPSRFL